MRRCLVFFLLLGIASLAAAADTGNVNHKADVWQDHGDHGVGWGDGNDRTGGDTIASATPINVLPFYDVGNTGAFSNDYDEVCPYSGSTSPDVVYSYLPGASGTLTVDLCASSYDTKVYVYQGGQGNLVACNDDAGCGYSGWQSKLQNIPVSAGITYYIVIDGYGGSSGEYSLAATSIGVICPSCPAGALQEGEPPCVDNYYDEFNGGCNTTGWTLIQAQADNCATMCGSSCTYLYQGLSYRDTDWYSVAGVGGSVEAECTAQFPLQLILIYGTDCANLQYTLGTGGTCEPVSLSWDVAPGAEVWVWVGSQVFTGIPESDYVLGVCGIQQVETPIEPTSWGMVKKAFR